MKSAFGPKTRHFRGIVAILFAAALCAPGCSDDPGETGGKDASAKDAGTTTDGQNLDDTAAADVGGAACPEGSACDDNNPCTTDDKCNASLVCGGTAKDGGACDDGSKCSTGDTCQKGVCGGAPVACNDDDPCTKDACEPDKGCVFSKQTGIDCDDGDACTSGDKCFEGKCQPGETKKECPDAGPCGVSSCDPKTGQCSSANGNEGKDCDPGDKCVLEAKCKAGLCAGKAKDCDDDNACTLDSCNKDDGACDNDDLAMDDKPCDDGDACTVDDACAKGKCDKSAPKACDDGNSCTKDSCVKDGKCLYDPQDGQACDDGNSCTEDDKCSIAAKCSGTDKCDCKKDADCPDDGNLCTGVLKCDLQSAKCKLDPATVVTCDPAKGACKVNACDAKTGKCALGNAKDGAKCDDSSKCTTSDVCIGGTCGGTAVKCGDGAQCKGMKCDPAKGCVTETAKDGDACDADGDACTVGDQCQGGACTKGKPKSCDDGNPCTADSCDAKTGACKATAGGKTDATACDADGSVCTVGDACAGGKCIAGKPKVCNDNEPCTDNVCDKTKGCTFTANNAPCDDGNQCTKGDVCSGAKCTSGAAVTCDDGDKCTTDTCDKSKGCVYTAISGCNSTNKTWTVLLYLAADNNLETNAITDIDELLKVSAADHLRFVIQFDRSDSYSSDPVGGISDFKTTKRLLIEKGKLSEIKDLGELNTGDPKHLEEFIAWGLSTYPSDRKMLVLWNHGHAWQGFGGDDSSGNNDALTLAEMSSAIKAALASAKVSKFDIIGFDACLMASLTTAQVMQPYADYLLASEDLVPGNGWDYTQFELIAKTPNVPVADLGKQIIDGFKAQSDQLKKGTSITLALLDLSKLQPVSDAVQTLANALGKDLKTLATKIGQSRDRVQEFGRSDNPEDAYFQIDIGDLSEHMADLDSSLSAKKDDLLKALASLVVYQVSGQVTAEATGIALYFPPLEKYYLDKFEQLTGIQSWAQTVTGFYSEADSIDYQPTFEHGTTSGGQQGPGPKFKPIGIAGHDEPIGGNGDGTEQVNLPYVEDFNCSSSTADKWVFTYPNADAFTVHSKWGVDLTPIGVGNNCTLNFNSGVHGYLCKAKSGTPSKKAYAQSPWIVVDGKKLLYIGVVPAHISGWSTEDVFKIEGSADGKNWKLLHYMLGPTSQSATVDLTKVFAGAKRIKLRLVFAITKCDGQAPIIPGTKLPFPGPAIEKFVVFSPGNPCDGKSKGDYCEGQERIECDTYGLLGDRETCEFGCDDSAGKSKAVCASKTYGTAGEVSVTCKNGILNLSAKIDSATLKNVARARLRYGYNSPQDYGLSGVDSGDGQKTSYPQFFGSVKAEVAKDGSITAAWDQSVLVAKHPRGRTILFSRRTITKNVDHHEVPINYKSGKPSPCPCGKLGAKAYNDLDKDGVADCLDFDVDGDGVLNVADNCPWIKNEDQALDNNGNPKACGKNADGGKPKYACEPVAEDAGYPGVWHVDLDLKTGDLISQTLYVRKPYGISAITPEKGGLIVAQTMRRTGVEVPAFLFTGQSSYPNPPIPAFIADSKDLVFDTMPLEQVPFLIPKTEQNAKEFKSVCPTYQSASTSLAYCSYPSGLPYNIADARNLTDLWLQLIIEDIGGRGDSVIYRGPVPDGCLAPVTACPSGQLRDCLGNCVNAKLKGDGKCDMGVGLGPHLRCERHNWDGKDCSDCDEEGLIRDCQGNCHSARAIDRVLGNNICNDGSQDIDPPVAGRVQGPDLRCALFSYDEGDCEGGKHDEPGQCSPMTEAVDCDGQCITDVQMAEAPPGNTQVCRKRFFCERFGLDGGKCKPPSKATSCPSGCPFTQCMNNVCIPFITINCPNNCSNHGKCVDGKCECNDGWKGGACNVPRPIDTCCVPGKTPGCADSWVQACVCQKNPTCCSLEWSPACVGLAAKYCQPQCGAAKSCAQKFCGNAGDDPNSTIAVGKRHVCAIGKKGTVRCWGDGAGGKLGRGNTKSTTEPTMIPQVGGAVSIDAGNNHTCAINGGDLYCWGCNQSGQLGLNDYDKDRLTPTKVWKLTGTVKSVSASEDHTCAIVSNAGKTKLFCWGKSERGQVGDGKQDKKYNTPIEVLLPETAVQVATGAAHTCVRGDKGAVVCFGDQSFAQTGQGTSTDKALAKPTKVPGLSGVTSICAGTWHNCAVKSDGTVWCWGANGGSQTGQGGGMVKSPAKVSGFSNAVQVTCGAKHSCARLSNGRVRCWGTNTQGQMGNYVLSTTTTAFLVPAGPTKVLSVPALENIVHVEAGWRSTCAVDKGGEIWCWGDNTWGQLGNGRTGHRECEPSCMGKTCGYDGCGGVCGVCDAGTACKGNQCISCVPNCKDKNCGSDGCGGVCGDPKLFGACTDGSICDHHTGKCTLEKSCQGKCGRWLHGSSGLPKCYCGNLGALPAAVKKAYECTDAPAMCPTCQPKCTGKQCGDDGCGGVCGACPGGQECNLKLGQCQSPCVSVCGTAECGDDGCGGHCGTCKAGNICLDGKCGAPPCKDICDKRECGPNGCGGFCGSNKGQCPSGQKCDLFFGLCSGTCIPPCAFGQLCNPNTNKCGALPKQCSPACGTGYKCNTETGKCEKESIACNPACGPGYKCNTSTGKCEQDTTKCDPTCQPGFTCEAGKCKPPFEGCKGRCGELSYEPDGKKCTCSPTCKPQGQGPPPFCCQDKKAICG